MKARKQARSQRPVSPYPSGFLFRKAAAGEFDTAFYAVQVVELLLGITQLLLISLDFRDGLTLAGRLRRARP